MSILNYLIEGTNNRVTVYHGDKYGLDSINGNYKVISLEGSNQQEGPGIYFTTNKATSDMYGDKIVSTTVNPKMFMRSREQVGKYISVQNIAKMIKHINANDEDFWMVMSDYVEVSDPSGVTDRRIMEMANMLSRDQVRNFLITLEEKTDTENFVNAFSKYSKYYGTFHDDYDDGETHFAMLRNDDEPQPVNIEESSSFDDIVGAMANGEYPDEYFALDKDTQNKVLQAVKASRNPAPKTSPTIKQHHIAVPKVGQYGALYAMKKFVDMYDKYGAKDESEFDDETNRNYKKFKHVINTQEGA